MQDLRQELQLLKCSAVAHDGPHRGEETLVSLLEELANYSVNLIRSFSLFKVRNLFKEIRPAASP